MLVDFERAWHDLNEVITSKPHHGQKDLLAEMGRIQAQNRIEEGLPERALRLYGVVISDDLLRPNPAARRDEQPDGPDDIPAGSAGSSTSEEDTCQTQNSRTPRKLTPSPA